ncbi:MAG: CAP domain-containing protein [Candidatus Promineifilaceae bacterium]|nr:CAP domain-containing protein [Candidatus Promineifilaceae bacterium]
MSDRLKLTEEDIDRVLQQVQQAPPTPAVIRISKNDVPRESAVSQTPASSILKVTQDDLLPAQPQAANDLNLTELETLMFGLVNSARQAHLPRWLGGPNLRWHERLAEVARGHSMDMIKRHYVEHTSLEGVKVAQRIERSQIRYMACGENIGVVYGAASHGDQGIIEVHKAFMNQPKRLTNHRGNLLNPIWSHVGIGVAYDPGGTLIVTQNFIAKYG